MTDAIVKITSDGNTAIFCGEIEILAAAEIMSWISEQNIIKKHKHLNLIINSRGGSMSNSFAIIDSIMHSDIPVYTFGTGTIASGALAIFISGYHRTLYYNTSIMSHQPWDSVEGRELDFEAIEDYRRLSKQRLLKHYVKCTRLTKEIIEQELFQHKDRYLDSEQALSLKLCDIVIGCCDYYHNRDCK